MLRMIFCGVLTALLLPVSIGHAELPSAKIDFNRDVRPILQNHCWNCHGPDEETREADLRLDLRDSALLKPADRAAAIVPGDVAASELIRRIEAHDDQLMPPASFAKPLTADQVASLRAWVEQGAPFATHWAFVPAVRSAIPDVIRTDWPRNEVDRFVLSRLERDGLSPTPEADREIWLRRVTLDLTGLPPSVDERNAFLADASPDAHGTVVDRLLDSPRYAERMAMNWLDAARYADTNGYNNDEVRTLWPWRDWVIRAFASNMPFNQFLTEQIAGDLLPGATTDQKVATGFNRNHVLTTEGGIIEEEYRVEYVADRVHTTATVFLGLSMQCARCHDHKYDPLSQRDYYRFAAYFDNIPDKIVPYTMGLPNEPLKMAEPLLRVPSEAQLVEQQQLEQKQTDLTTALTQRATSIDDELIHWEQSLTTEQIATAQPAGLAAHFPLDSVDGDPSNGLRVANRVVAGQVGKVQGMPRPEEGRIGRSLSFDPTTLIEFADVGKFEADQPFTTAAWVKPASTEPMAILSRMDEANGFRGYDLLIQDGKVEAHFVDHWPDRGFKVVTREPLTTGQWHHVSVTYDGSRRSTGVKVYVDGIDKPFDTPVNLPLDGTLLTDQPFRLGRRTTSLPFKGLLDDVRLYSVAVSASDVARLARGEMLSDLQVIVATPRADRTAENQQRLREYYLREVDGPTRELRSQLAEIPGKLTLLEQTIPVTMVMGEMSPRRVTHILRRGAYDQPGDEVRAGVPSLFRDLPTEASTRLELAAWMTHPSHPSTARVAVNRWWEMLFGTGIVETVEDFGVQGALPSHPELLDWLATELVREQWNQRKILQLIVLSATYRQASHVTAELHERDPHNRLLSRGPRYRLPAEAVRDNALAISGLLTERVGGRSVKPYQPEGLWEDVSVERRDKYVPDFDSGLYRRSLYTFWKRTCPPPSMAAFDAPDRETCVARRARTNTPLQALVLLNDPTFVEASRKFAEHVALTPGDDQLKLDFAMRAALCRLPKPQESQVLLDMLNVARNRFAGDGVAAEKLLGVGHSPRTAAVAPGELAAWTTVTSLILNLDETISKP